MINNTNNKYLYIKNIYEYSKPTILFGALCKLNMRASFERKKNEKKNEK